MHQYTVLVFIFQPEGLIQRLSSGRIHYCYITLRNVEGKKFVLSSSLTIPDGSFLGDPQASYQPVQEMTLSVHSWLFQYYLVYNCQEIFSCVNQSHLECCQNVATSTIKDAQFALQRDEPLFSGGTREAFQGQDNRN